MKQKNFKEEIMEIRMEILFQINNFQMMNKALLL